MSFNYTHVIVRYGEMVLKGKNRKIFTQQLGRNVKRALIDFSMIEYSLQHDRLYLTLNGADNTMVVKALSNVFGISSFSLALRVETNIDEIVESSLSIAKNCEVNSFKVLARRNYKQFSYNSDEINRIVASKILQETSLHVDVHNPDLPLIIEVRSDYTYLTGNKFSGAGGFPVGSSDKVMLLLSGGIDSVVAGYLAQKRGMSLECIHFESQPYTSEQALDKVRQLAKKLSLNQSRIKLHIVKFTQMQMAINKNLPESYSITIMRRMMMRISESLALKNNCLALVNGESVGQVASQTLSSMSVIGSVVKIPIIRPLVTYDKSEIIALANKIDTYDISILPYEDCCTIFLPSSPTTRPNIAKCLKFEQWDYQSIIEETLASITTETIEIKDENNNLF
ncbi:MAG: tRNA uracil 4-sulfurtransferase ThiI [Erysipelotrichaceae bacterium]